MESSGGSFYYDLGHYLAGGTALLGSAWLGWKAAEHVTGEGRKWAVGVAVFLIVMGLAFWVLP